MRGTASVAVWAALGLFVQDASAASGAEVLVVPFQSLGSDVPADVPAKTTDILAAGLERAGLVVVSPDLEAAAGSAGRPKGPAADSGLQRRAILALERASEAIEEAEFGRAARGLSRTLKRLEAQRAALLDAKILSEGYLLLGTAFFRDGRSAEANRALERAVHFDPERRLDPAEYPPLFIRVFDRARFSALKAPRGKVEIRARRGSLILLDGRNMGQAPLILDDVLAGPHAVRIERVDEPSRTQAIRVPAGDTVVVVFEGASISEPQGPLLAAVAANRLTGVQLKAAARRGRRAGAQAVLLGGVFRTNTAFQVRSVLVSVGNGAVGRLKDIGFDHDFLSAEIEVFQLVEDVRRQAPGTPADPVPERPVRIAPDFTEARARAAAGGSDIKVRAGAPEPTEKPAEIYARGPAPVEAPSPGAGELPRVVPKDEARDRADDRSRAFAGLGAGRPDEDEGGSLWWLWLIAGVVVAGAATGGVFAATQGGDGDVATVRAGW